MEITEVRVKLMEEPGERLLAFCSITFDHCFVIRDLKIIDGSSGPFVAMPSRKLTARCPRCRCKNYMKAAYCNQCGLKLQDAASADWRDDSGRMKLYADIAHPINTQCREMIQQAVVRAYEAELERSKLPGYVSSYSDFADDGSDYGEETSDCLPSQTGPHFNMGDDSKTVKENKTIGEKASRQGDFGAGIFE